MQLRALLRCHVEERLPRKVGADDPRLGLEEHRPAVRDADRPALAGRFGLQQLVFGSPSVESVARARRGVADQLEQAVELKEPLARLGLELPPARERLLCELNPLGLGVRQPDDARAAVARPAHVTDVELLVDLDVVPTPRELPRRCGAHDPRSHDRDPGHLASNASGAGQSCFAGSAARFGVTLRSRCRTPKQKRHGTVSRS